MINRKIFIATHSNLSEGFKSAAKLIVGSSADYITTFSLYEGGSAEEFSNEIKRYKNENPTIDVVVLTDLYGASLFNAMIEFHNIPGIFVLTGINLALVLDLLIDESKISDVLLKEKITESKKGIILLEEIDVETGDEF